MSLTLNGVAPMVGAVGESLDLILSGIDFQKGAVVSLGDGVIVQPVDFRSETQVTATVTISDSAPFGPRDVIITNPDAQSCKLPAGFYVLDRSDKNRKDLLLTMYIQMWKNIDTHILVVWQSVAAVLGALAIFGLVEKGFLPVDIASAFVVLLAGWLMAHVYDAWEWFYRNLVILTNIERQFLKAGDLRDIHPFFGSHRCPAKPVTHLRIQWYLGFGIAALVLVYHFSTRVLPGFGSSWSSFDPLRCVPYLAATAGSFFLVNLRRKVLRSNEAMLSDSPGLTINAPDLHGHP
jgi:hypothetical protein